jgi:hypothetical protein
MSEEILNQAANLAEGAGSAVDGLVKQAVDAAATHIPGGEKVAELLDSKMGQNVTEAISDGLTKGVEGIAQNVQGFLGKE